MFFHLWLSQRKMKCTSANGRCQEGFHSYRGCGVKLFLWLKAIILNRDMIRKQLRRKYSAVPRMYFCVSPPSPGEQLLVEQCC